jgi:glycosyltransferase involved in cell wall biosynthesis
MKSNPKVSIIIPVYNGSNYLHEAIESALSQTYPNIEVLVVNDGSNDNGKTDSIARSFEQKIRYFEKPNGGVASAVNLGIREMDGEYFSWLIHDDMHLPDKIEKQLDFLKNAPPNSIVFSDYEVIDSTGKVISTRINKCIRPMWLEIIYSFPVNMCTILIPKACFDKVGFFNETLLATQDNDMAFRLSNFFPFVYLPEIVMRSRRTIASGIK